MANEATSPLIRIAPKGGGKKGKGNPQPGTTPGTYTATVAGVTADGYEWDQVETSCDFIIN